MTERDDQTPRVSVIIPCYNHAHFLRDALGSVQAQTFTDFEAVVVDDGSTDDTREVTESFADPRIRYLYQENKGLPGARNTGIRAARGAYIALLDADDIWEPAYLATVVSYLDAHPHHGAVHTGCYFIDEEGDRLPQVSTTTVDPLRMFDHLVEGEFFIPSAVLTRRACFDRVGLFDESLRASEDWDIWLRVAREFPFGSLGDLLLNYRIHGSNMSGDPGHMRHYQLAVVAKHFGRPDGPPADWPEPRRRSYGAVYRYAAQGYFFRGDWTEGVRHLRLAFETDPRLLTSLDLYYELGCSDQPLGRRVAGPHLAIEKNEARIRRALAAVFDNPLLDPAVARGRRPATGQANHALGLLAYGAGRLDLVRLYFWRAFRARPTLLFHLPFARTWAKSLLGRALLARLKNGRPTADVAGTPP